MRQVSIVAVTLVIAGLLAPAAASATPTAVTLYVDNANGTVTTGCTAAGAGACQTIFEGISAAEALTGDPAVTVDVAASGTDYLSGLDIDDQSDASLDIAGAGAATTTITGSAAPCAITITSGAPVTISGFTITGGAGDTGGGAICNEFDLTLMNDTISDNTGAQGAGLNNVGTATVTDVAFSDNTASGDGGAIYNGGEQEAAELTVTGSTFSGDSANRGGALFNGGNGFTFTGDTVSNETAVQGGAIANYDHGEVDGTSFTNDRAIGSGTQGVGGAIYNYDQSMTLRGDTFSGSSATGSGGAIDTTGPITATQSTFAGDSAPYGGGLTVGGFVTLTNDTLFHDSATVSGGAVYDISKVTMSDDTLSSDTAPAGEGPGIEDGNTVLLGNSILDDAGCTVPLGSTMTSEGFNVESDNTCALGVSNKVSNTAIGLSPSLAVNGATGPETLAIGATSSAVDEVPAAGCAAVSFDERGDKRPGATGQTACDAGAYEYQGAAPKPPPAKHTPSAPRSPQAKAGKKLITVSWRSPSTTGGAEISGYVAYCAASKHPSTKNSKATKVTGSKRSAEVKSLTAGKKYYCDVVAKNSVGTSKASSVVSATPRK